MAEITEPLAKDDTCIDVEPAEIKSTGKRLPKDSGGGFEFVTSLPQEGGDSGVEYLLVDDAESPTQFFGGYMYEDENWIQTSLATNQLVAKVTELPETGEEGVLYYLEKEDETDTFDLYRWINEEWVKLDTDVKLYTTTGANVDGPMTQKATSNLIYQEGQETTHNNIIMGAGASLPSFATQIGNVVIYGQQQNGYRGVAIGKNAQVSGNDTIAIGGGSINTLGPRALGQNGIAVGNNAIVLGNYSYSVALGADSQVARNWELSIGGRATNNHTRYIANVTDPELPQDAATKNYVDDNTTLVTNEDWSTLWQ